MTDDSRQMLRDIAQTNPFYLIEGVARRLGQILNAKTLERQETERHRKQWEAHGCPGNLGGTGRVIAAQLKQLPAGSVVRSAVLDHWRLGKTSLDALQEVQAVDAVEASRVRALLSVSFDTRVAIVAFCHGLHNGTADL